MKRFIVKILLLFPVFAIVSCVDSLNIAPKQVLDESLLTKPEDMEGFVTAAYAKMTDIPSFDSPYSPWWSGSLRSDDSYKGGGGTWDGDGWHDMEVFVNVNPNGWPLDAPWYQAYQVIQRCNTAIQKLQDITEEEFPMKDARLGEVLFIRTFTHFRLKQFFKYVPYIDEEVIGTSADFEAIPNRIQEEPDDQYLWERIVTDFKKAENLLPDIQSEKGRIDKNAATAMIANTLMYMAYEQDERHSVVNLDKAKLTEALEYLNKLTDQENDKLGLQKDFAENFDLAFDNQTKESIWEIQYSIDDGSSTGGKINRGEGLNHPFEWEGFQCCGFHHISYSMGNAFKTDADGLPLFDTYNESSYMDDEEAFLKNNTFDPRFSHTIAVPGLPWKYDPELIFEKKGVRNAAEYGYFKSIKELPEPDCNCLLYDGWQFNSMNKKMIRYDEVLLWKAEVLIQLDRWDESLPLINQVRERAANSTDRLVFQDGSPTLNYHVERYKPGENCIWDKEFAWKALQWEMRLEMAGEGRRFFDLQRWGTLDKTMNEYFETEKSRFSWMAPARFTSGRDEYLPIPQPQINWAKGNYLQNRGY
ncbi:MAG TPA: RagB/SusD family nutrient uptake outer membrane protein [Sphingobacterium sp.]|nr:RagB/SusD family nutrient uptake outer membrane protein [Sphingobacterium sp.]